MFCTLCLETILSPNFTDICQRLGALFWIKQISVQRQEDYSALSRCACNDCHICSVVDRYSRTCSVRRVFYLQYTSYTSNTNDINWRGEQSKQGQHYRQRAAAILREIEQTYTDACKAPIKPSSNLDPSTEDQQWSTKTATASIGEISAVGRWTMSGNLSQLIRDIAVCCYALWSRFFHFLGLLFSFEPIHLSLLCVVQCYGLFISYITHYCSYRKRLHTCRPCLTLNACAAARCTRKISQSPQKISFLM